MLFNSLEFALFLPIVFLLYWFVFDYALRRCKYQLWLQNLFIVIVSYIFYGWWDWRFLFLIAFTSFCSWGSGLLIRQAQNQQPNGIALRAKCWMILNIVLNLAILGIFKYYDFFVTSFASLFHANPDGLLLKIILPVGISFYTFQALSYSIDVYRKHLEPTKDIVSFFAYVSFFPQLVAGPIERATNLLPQFQHKRTFDYALAVDGMRQILWGLFKKIVVADNCATYVDKIFATYQNQTGSTLLLAAVLFTFQIYGDFSGYSDIAIGTGKLFGIKLMRNFNVPYFSRDIAEFWRRWHISLTTWFRDYVYIPLGGSRPVVPEHIQHPNRYKKWIIVRNTFVIFLISGFWHGANWTFVVWGAYHAFLFLPLILLGKNRKYTNIVAENRWFPSLRECCQMFVTFLLVVIGWIIFRATSIDEAWQYIQNMAQLGTLRAFYRFFTWEVIRKQSICILIMLLVEWLGRKGTHSLEWIDQLPILRIKYIRLALFVFAFLAMLFFRGGLQDFIYFQF